MQELLEFAFSGINLIPTILMIFIIIYWIIVIVGVIDVDSLDFDLDMDADADIDMDADVDVDGEVELSGFSSVLAFFNIGQMPLMIFVTFFTLPLWTITLLINDAIGNGSVLIGILVVLGTSFVSLFVAKFLTTPIAKFYRKVKEQTEAVVDIIGKICTAKLPVNSERTSQAEIKVNGTSVLINVKTREGFTVPKGATALVIDFDESQKCYYVEPYYI